MLEESNNELIANLTYPCLNGLTDSVKKLLDCSYDPIELYGEKSAEINPSRLGMELDFSHRYIQPSVFRVL